MSRLASPDSLTINLADISLTDNGDYQLAIDVTARGRYYPDLRIKATQVMDDLDIDGGEVIFTVDSEEITNDETRRINVTVPKNKVPDVNSKYKLTAFSPSLERRLAIISSSVPEEPICTVQ